MTISQDIKLVLHSNNFFVTAPRGCLHSITTMHSGHLVFISSTVINGRRLNGQKDVVVVTKKSLLGKFENVLPNLHSYGRKVIMSMSLGKWTVVLRPGRNDSICTFLRLEPHGSHQPCTHAMHSYNMTSS